jgi:hypothetical protein
MVFGAPPHPPQNKQFVIVFFYYIGGPYTKKYGSLCHQRFSHLLTKKAFFEVTSK